MTWEACRNADLVTLQFDNVKLTVAKQAVIAVDVLFDCFRRHCYSARSGVTGAYNCRKITGGSQLSKHAYGIAIDVNWDTNPYSRKFITDMPKAMTDEVQSITTIDGVRVWRWGGDWDNNPGTPHRFYDTMHFEIIASPQELSRGIHRTIHELKGPGYWPILRRGARGQAVVVAQSVLGATADGIFGRNTEAAVRDFQAKFRLEQTGVIGLGEWTLLLNELQPDDYIQKG